MIYWGASKKCSAAGGGPAASIPPRASVLPEAARDAVEFYARSLLCGALDQSARIGEGVRVKLWPDDEDPDWVMLMRGHAHLPKDGAPIDLYWYAPHCNQYIFLAPNFAPHSFSQADDRGK